MFNPQQQRIVSRSPLRTQAHTNPNLLINPSPTMKQMHPLSSPYPPTFNLAFDNPELQNKSPIHHQRSLTDNKLQSPLNQININPLTASYFQQQKDSFKPKESLPFSYQYNSNKQPQSSSPQGLSTSILQKQLKQIPLQHDCLPIDMRQMEINKLKSDLNSAQEELKDFSRKVLEQDQQLRSKTSEIVHLSSMIQQLQDNSSNDSKIQSIYSHRKAEEMLLNENEELRQVILDYQQSITKMRNEQPSREQLQNLRKQIEEYERINSLYDSLKADNENLMKLYKEKQWEFDAVSNKLRTMADDYQRLLESRNKLEQDMESLDQQYRKEIQFIKNEQQTQNKFDDLIRGHIIQIEEANQQLQMKIEQGHQLEQELQETRQALSLSQERQKLLQQKVIELHDGIDTKNTQIDEMVIKYDESYQRGKANYEKQIQILKQDLGELNQHQQQREGLINQLIKELEDQHRKDVGYHQQVNQLNDNKDHQSYYINELSRMKKDLVEKNEEIEHLKLLIEKKK